MIVPAREVNRGVQDPNACDPVAVWLRVRPARVRGPRHPLRFLFQGRLVKIVSNSAKVIAFLREHVAMHYPIEAGLAENPNETRIEIHIAQYGRDRRVVLPAGEGTGMKEAIALPTPLETVSSDEFVHMRWEGVESFWRPFNLLGSLRLSIAPSIQLLIPWPPMLSGERESGGDGFPVRRSVRRACAPPLDEIADLTLTMMVRARGHFCLHAATLVDRERGILLTGPSGSGKTTTALSLLRSGFELLGDEHSILNANEGRPLITGLRGTPRVVGQGLRTLAELERSLESGIKSKTPFTIPPALAPMNRSRWVAPAVVFFLRIGQGEATHRLIKMPVEEAFVRLTRQVLDPTNVFRKGEQAQALIGLVEHCPAYELVLSRNLTSLPDLVRGVLRSTA